MNLLKHILAALLLTLTVGPVQAESSPAPHPFVVGERLTYQIYWGPLVAGKAVLEVLGIEQVDGQDCYHIRATAKTTGLADVLFQVKSSSESWLDVDELCSRRFRQNRSEGKKTTRDETRFDYPSKEFSITNFLDHSQRRFPLETTAVDVIGAIYLMRTQPLALNSNHAFTVNARRTNQLVRISPNERRTIWIRPLGDVPALRLEPKPTLRIVAANKGRMFIWVSDDKRRLPLLVTSQMSIGTAKLVLDKIELPQPVAPARPTKRPFDFSSKH